MKPQSVAALNRLPPEEKMAIFGRLVPPALLERFGISKEFTDPDGRSLLKLESAEGRSDMVAELRHDFGAQDPILYAHLTDTVNGQIHVLLYIINDPASPRFDVDRMPDGTPTEFGTLRRNLEAERDAMAAGLAPGQIHSGLRMLRQSIEAFDRFVSGLGHSMYFNEPLYYHNAIIFERYGFAYQSGRRVMEEIHQGFSPGGRLLPLLDSSTPFRQPWQRSSIRGRSWALHDRILGKPFTGVTMYKNIGLHAGVDTFPGAIW